jgi:peptide/nickel transport system substrate-binding protein
LKRPFSYLDDIQTNMKKLRWQLLVIFLALIAISILLLGQQPVSQQVVNVVEPTTGGLYIEGLVGTFGRLNPLLDSNNLADQDINRLIFSRLIKFDERGNPQPDLAEKWGISLDGMVYNIALNPTAFWHDGSPVTADDVIFSIEMMRNPDYPTSPDIVDLWDRVEVTRFDDHTLQIRLPEPYSPFIDYLNFSVLPKHLLDGLSFSEMVESSFNLSPVGSGPYQFDQLIVDNGVITGVILKSFIDFYMDRSFIDQIVFQYYPNAASAMEAYREGDILGISHIDKEVLSEVLEDPNLNHYVARQPQVSLIFLNLGNLDILFFQEILVRKALLQGLNRQWMIGQILEGQAFMADGPILPNTWAYYEGLSRVEYNPDEAIEKLKNAGFVIPAEGGEIRSKENVRLEFELLYPDTETHTAIANAIHDDWEVIGVNAKLVAVSYEVLIRDFLETRDYEAALVDLNLEKSPDPDPYPFWHQAQMTGGQNYSMWDDRRASEYLERARITVNLNERTRLYKNFQVHFSREVPALLLFYPVYNFAIDRQVLGVQVGPLFETSDRFVTLSEWYLVAKGISEESVTPEGTP